MPTIVPLISSDTAGPLGAVHLPRLWTKLSLAAHGMLPEGYDECGPGFDAMTLAAFNLDRQKTIDYVRQHHPTYMEFEAWVVAQNGGHIEKAAIEKHNAAVRGYHHSDETGAKMRAASGIKDAAVKDAVRLNCVDDLDEFYRSLGH
ncbi:MAG TPA: DUF5069 domain-containing protein [Verrucomicrobiae bacterium]|nr:DUF5069 domain-containing protein [Verrucomicrobiae bacterium]